MDVQPIDPRDIQWEEDTPVFRLTFWRRQAVPSNTMPEHAGYEAKELEISGAKAGDILVWTQGEGVARKRRGP